MKKLGLILTVALLVFVSNGYAGIELGVNGHAERSDNFYLNNPNGWSMFLSKSLSKKLSLRATYTQFDKDKQYLGDFAFGLIPPDYVAERELIFSKTSATIYELSLHHTIIRGTRMRLEGGVGIGLANFKLGLYGGKTGSTMSSNKSLSSLMLSLSVLVKEVIFKPLNLRLGYEYRTFGEGSITLDGFEPFLDVTISGLRVGLSVRW